MVITKNKSSSSVRKMYHIFFFEYLRKAGRAGRGTKDAIARWFFARGGIGEGQNSVASTLQRLYVVSHVTFQLAGWSYDSRYSPPSDYSRYSL
jgi:hypothetical protein